MKLFRIVAAAAIAFATLPASGADFPAPKQGDWVAPNFKFHSGEIIPKLSLHYTIIGEPTGEPVLFLHGTTGSSAGLVGPNFAGELFGPGQALDARKYFIIIPDALGHGKSSKPSDGLKTKYPQYNYDDMVDAQYRLVSEGLGIRHLRLVIGNSMGGMNTWIWGGKYPDFMDALVPMAAQPSAMASRNWMLRRLLIETVRNDPDYKDGNYTSQPHSMKIANLFFAVATSGGTLAYQQMAPTTDAANKFIDARLAVPMAADANDYIYQWNSSRDYDASPGLERINAALLAVNAADDERNPPESGIMERDLKRVKNGRLLLIPASEETRGHGTTGLPRFWAKEVQEFLDTVPKRSM